MRNFKVGKEIKSLLENDSNVSKYIDNRVFPIVANEGTEFPFVVYRRIGYSPLSNKDYMNEKVQVEITVLSQKYDEGVNVADAVATALNQKQTNIIDEIIISNISEDYSSDTFIQKLFLDIYLV